MRLERSEGWNLVVRRSWGIGAAVVAALVLPAIGVLAGVALASSAFDDVDPDGVHVEGIDWLADSGVTAGCEVGRFCPNDAVTREQMGTFLYRVSGNDPRVAPSVNAVRLQGLTVQQLFEAFESGELPEGLPTDDPTGPGDPADPADPADPGDPDGGDEPDEPTTPGEEDELAVLSDRIAQLEESLVEFDARLSSIDDLLDAEDDGDGRLGAAVVSLSVRLAEQADALEELEAEVAQQQQAIDEVEPEVDRLATLLDGVSRELVNQRPTLRFSGMNVQVVNGTERTDVTNGVGNLIIGYDAPRTAEDGEGQNSKSGSHYLVVGDGNNYSSYGGIVAGTLNTASGPWATVVGGTRNLASGDHATVTGGRENAATRQGSAVAGGRGNEATGGFAVVSGGRSNVAGGIHSSVSGGRENGATGEQSAVTGGYRNTAEGPTSSVSGGNNNRAFGDQASILGGSERELGGVFLTSPPS